MKTSHDKALEELGSPICRHACALLVLAWNGARLELAQSWTVPDTRLAAYFTERGVDPNTARALVTDLRKQPIAPYV